MSRPSLSDLHDQATKLRRRIRGLHVLISCHPDRKGVFEDELRIASDRLATIGLRIKQAA